VRERLHIFPLHAFQVGAYTIGKERVWLAAAKQLHVHDVPMYPPHRTNALSPPH
jgi:hypothetical protein